MVRFIVATVAFALLLSFPTVDASEAIEFTVYERQSDDGPRHSPLFTLDVGEGEFPSKMVLFNNDLYGSEDDLINEDEANKTGYNQVRRSNLKLSVGSFPRAWRTRVSNNLPYPSSR